MLELQKILERQDGDQEASDLQATLATTHQRYMELIKKLELKHGDVSDSHAPRVGAFLPRFDLEDLSALREQRHALIKHIALRNDDETPQGATYSKDVLEQIENAGMVGNDLDSMQRYLYDVFLRRQDALQRQSDLLIGRRRLCNPEVNAQALPAVADAVARIQKQLEMGERRLSRLYQKGAQVNKTIATPISTYGKPLFEVCMDSHATLSCVFKADIVLALRLNTASNEQWISRFQQQMANLELTHAAEIIRTMQEFQLTLRDAQFPQKAPQKLVNFHLMEDTLLELSRTFGITISVAIDGGHAFAHAVSADFTGIFNKQENSRPWHFKVIPSRKVHCTPRIRECVKHQAVLMGLSGMPKRTQGMKEGGKSVNTASAVRDDVKFDQVEDSLLKAEFDALELSDAKDAIRIFKGKASSAAEQSSQGHLVRAFFHLRYLKNRAQLQDLMKYYNVCRYILQRLDPIDDVSASAEETPPRDDERKPNLRAVLIESRDAPLELPKDTTEMPAVYWRNLLDIVDGSDRPVAYEGSREDFRHAIKQLVRIGTFFLRRSKDVERGALMADLLDSEVRFVTAKLHLLEKYMEIYEHVVDVKEASELRQQIVDTIYKRPCLDTTAPYFETCYILEISILSTKCTMLSTLMEVQRANEHRVRRVHAQRIQGCRTGLSPMHIPNSDAQLDLTSQLAFPYEGYLENGQGPSIKLTPFGAQTFSTEFLPSLGLCWKLELLVDDAFQKMQRLLQATVPELPILELSVYTVAEVEFDKLMRANARSSMADGGARDATSAKGAIDTDPRESTNVQTNGGSRAASLTLAPADTPEAIPEATCAKQTTDGLAAEAPECLPEKEQTQRGGTQRAPQHMARGLFAENDAWLAFVCDEILTQVENPNLHAQLPTRDLLEFKKMSRAEMTLIIYSNMLQIVRTYQWLQDEMLSRSLMEACLHAQYTLCEVTPTTYTSHAHAAHMLSSPHCVLATELFEEAEIAEFRDKLGVYLANTRQHDIPVFYQYELSRRWLAHACVMHNVHLMVPFMQARMKYVIAAHGVSNDVMCMLSRGHPSCPSRQLYHVPIESRDEHHATDAQCGRGDEQFFANSNLLVHVGSRPQVLGDVYRTFVEKEQERLRKTMGRKGMTETLKKTRALQVQAVSYVSLILTQQTIDILTRVQCCDVVNECRMQLPFLAECALNTPFIVKNPISGVMVNLKTFPTVRELCQLSPAFAPLAPDEVMTTLNSTHANAVGATADQAPFEAVACKPLPSHAASDLTAFQASNVARLSPLLRPSTGTTMLCTLQYMSSLLGFMFFLSALEGNRQSVLKLRLQSSGKTLTHLLSLYDPTLEAIQNFQQDFLRLGTRPPKDQKLQRGSRGRVEDGGEAVEDDPAGSPGGTSPEPMLLSHACAFLAEKHRVVTAKVALVLYNLAQRCAKNDCPGAVSNVLQWLRFAQSSTCTDTFVHNGGRFTHTAGPAPRRATPYYGSTSAHRGTSTFDGSINDASRWPLFDDLFALSQIELPSENTCGQRDNACSYSSNCHGGLRGCSFAYALCEIENELRHVALMLAVEADMYNAAPTGHHTTATTKRVNHVHTCLLHARLRDAALLTKLQVPPPRTASELATVDRVWLSMTHDVDERLKSTKVTAQTKHKPSPSTSDGKDSHAAPLSGDGECTDHHMMEVAAVHRVMEECAVGASALDSILILHTIDVLNADSAALADVTATYLASALQRDTSRRRKNVALQSTHIGMPAMEVAFLAGELKDNDRGSPKHLHKDSYAVKQDLVLSFVNRLRQRATVVRTDMVGRAYILREGDLDYCAKQLGEGLLYWGAQMSGGRRDVTKKMTSGVVLDNIELRRLVQELKQTIATTDDNRNAKVNAMVSERALALMFENDDLKRRLQDLSAASSEVEYRLQCQWKIKMSQELANLRRELQLQEGRFLGYKEDLGNAIHDELRHIRLSVADRLKNIGDTALLPSQTAPRTVTGIPETARIASLSTKRLGDQSSLVGPSSRTLPLRSNTALCVTSHPSHLAIVDTGESLRESLGSPRIGLTRASANGTTSCVDTKDAQNVAAEGATSTTKGTRKKDDGGNFLADKAKELKGLTVEALVEEVLAHKKALIANKTILNLKIQTMQEKYERQIRDQALTLGSNGELWARLSEACAQERTTQEDLVKASKLVQLQGATVDSLTAQVEHTQEQRQRLLNWKRSTGARLEKLEDLVAKSKNNSDVNITTVLQDVAKKDAMIRQLQRELAKATCVDNYAEVTETGQTVTQITTGRAKTTVASFEKEIARLKHELKSERSMKLRAFEKLRLMQHSGQETQACNNIDFSSHVDGSMKDDFLTEEEEDAKPAGQFTVLDSWRKKPVSAIGRREDGVKVPTLTSSLRQQTPRTNQAGPPATVGPRVDLGRQLKTAGLVISSKDSLLQNEKLKFPQSAR